MVCGYGSRKRLVGITSWTVSSSNDFFGEYTCGWKDLHGVFTKISHYSEWINENLLIKDKPPIPTTSTNRPMPTPTSTTTSWTYPPMPTFPNIYPPINVAGKSFSDSYIALIYSEIIMILIIWT